METDKRNNVFLYFFKIYEIDKSQGNISMYFSENVKTIKMATKHSFLDQTWHGY